MHINNNKCSKSFETVKNNYIPLFPEAVLFFQQYSLTNVLFQLINRVH